MPATANHKDGKSEALREVGIMMVCGVKKDPTVLNRVADLLKETCGYRWVGIYKVARKNFILVGSSLGDKPAAPQFPTSQGVSAEVYETRETVIVRDVSKEPRFLPNFWTTKSEIVVPIIDDEHDRVAGIINVESAKHDAFGPRDRDFLEGVGRLIWRALR
jgi:GAF domain-containing protein